MREPVRLVILTSCLTTNKASSLTGFFIDGTITGANAACPK